MFYHVFAMPRCCQCRRRHDDADIYFRRCRFRCHADTADDAPLLDATPAPPRFSSMPLAVISPMIYLSFHCRFAARAADLIFVYFMLSSLSPPLRYYAIDDITSLFVFDAAADIILPRC